MLVEVKVLATREYVRIALPQFDAGTVVKNVVTYRQGEDGR